MKLFPESIKQFAKGSLYYTFLNTFHARSFRYTCDQRMRHILNVVCFVFNKWAHRALVIHKYNYFQYSMITVKANVCYCTVPYTFVIPNIKCIKSMCVHHSLIRNSSSSALVFHKYNIYMAQSSFSNEAEMFLSFSLVP